MVSSFNSARVGPWYRSALSTWNMSSSSIMNDSCLGKHMTSPIALHIAFELEVAGCMPYDPAVGWPIDGVPYDECAVLLLLTEKFDRSLSGMIVSEH